jgi:hypothetical protein
MPLPLPVTPRRRPLSHPRARCIAPEYKPPIRVPVRTHARNTDSRLPPALRASQSQSHPVTDSRPNRENALQHAAKTEHNVRSAELRPQARACSRILLLDAAWEAAEPLVVTTAPRPGMVRPSTGRETASTIWVLPPPKHQTHLPDARHRGPLATHTGRGVRAERRWIFGRTPRPSTRPWRHCAASVRECIVPDGCCAARIPSPPDVR